MVLTCCVRRLLSHSPLSALCSEGECKVWRANEGTRLEAERTHYLVPPAVALTVETTAYALLTALAHGDTEEAKAAACFLSSQENYEGGFKSTQVRQSRSTRPLLYVWVEFTGEQGQRPLMDLY